jgi:hypothetical protein
MLGDIIIKKCHPVPLWQNQCDEHKSTGRNARMTPYNITVNDEGLKDLFSGDAGTSKLLEPVLKQVLQAQTAEQVRPCRMSVLRSDRVIGTEHVHMP